MRGEEYLGYSKPRYEKMRQDQPRESLQLGEACTSEFCRKSKFRGCIGFDEDTRKSIHAYFWKKLDWNQRKVYVGGLVNRTTTSQKTKGQTDTRRVRTYNYFLPGENNEGNIQVCKQMFLNTLSLKSTTVQTWAKNAGFNIDAANPDNSQGRETKNNPKNVALENFLKSIPKMPSHYARRDTRKLYLEPVYRSVSDVFKAYKQYCSATNNSAVSRYTFDKVFSNHNLALFTLKKDMCDICVGHEEGNIDEHAYQEHLIKKNRAREEKEKDKKDAALGNCILLTMDLEAVKVCPYSTASALYFKTKLTCHNFTLFDLIMECDSVHSAIERKLTNRVIHLPCDYVSATKEARASCPYEVIQIDHQFVKNYADQTNWLYKSIRPGRKAGDPTVTDIRCILYDKDRDEIQVKLHFDQDWFGLPQRHKSFNPGVSYSPLRSTMIPISASKYQHLQELKQILPRECHNFYDTLPHL